MVVRLGSESDMADCPALSFPIEEVVALAIGVVRRGSESDVADMADCFALSLESELVKTGVVTILSSGEFVVACDDVGETVLFSAMADWEVISVSSPTVSSRAKVESSVAGA